MQQCKENLPINCDLWRKSAVLFSERTFVYARPILICIASVLSVRIYSNFWIFQQFLTIVLSIGLMGYIVTGMYLIVIHCYTYQTIKIMNVHSTILAIICSHRKRANPVSVCDLARLLFLNRVSFLFYHLRPQINLYLLFQMSVKSILLSWSGPYL